MFTKIVELCPCFDGRGGINCQRMQEEIQIGY